MTETSPQWDLLDPATQGQWEQIMALPMGPDRLARSEAMLTDAQFGASFPAEFVARSEILTVMYYLPDDPRALTHYAWLRRSLGGRDLADEDRLDVLWKMKWAMSAMLDNPRMSLDAVRSSIDDIAVLFETEGFSQRPVEAHRAWLAQETGDQDRLAEAMRAWEAAPRDELSDCHACELRERAGRLRDLDPVAATELLQPVLDGEVTCAEEPGFSLSVAAELALERGDLEATIDLHRRGWRLAHDKPALSPAMCRHLLLLTRLGNVDRSVHLLVPRLPWRDELVAPDEREYFAAVAGFVLAVAAATGVAPESVDGRPVAELAGELDAEADELASLFDQRNASTAHAERLARIRDRSLILGEPTLPLLHVAPPTRSTEPEMPGLIELDSGVEIRTRARALRAALDDMRTDPHELCEAWRRDRERLLPEVRDEDVGEAAFLERVAASTAPPDIARRMIMSSESLGQRARDEVAGLRAAADLAVLDTLLGRANARQEAVAIADRLEGRGRLADAAAVWSTLAARVPGPDAVAETVRSADLFARAGQPVRQALSLVDAARLSAPDPGAVQAFIAQAYEVGGGHPQVVAQATDLQARMAYAEGDLPRSLHLHRQAVETDIPERQRAAMRFAIADILVDRSDWPALEQEGRDLVGTATRMRDPHLMAIGQRFLGLALLEQGRTVEATEMLEACLPVIAAQEPMLAGPVGWALGNALTELGEHLDAAAAYRTAASSFEAVDRWPEAGMAMARFADCAWEGGQVDQAMQGYDAATELARRCADLDLFVRVRQAHASLRAHEGEVDAAVADLDHLVDEARTAGEEAGVDLTAYDLDGARPAVQRLAAQLLAVDERLAEAIDRLVRAEAGADEELATICRAERGDLLAREGRVDASFALLRQALPRMFGEELDEVRVDAAASLAQALDDVGRVEEANWVWESFGSEATPPA